MNFIDDIDFVLSLIGFEPRLLDEITHIFYAIVARSIDLDTVEHDSILECMTIPTFMAGIPILKIRTIHSLRKDTLTGRFSRSARSMKEVGMSNSTSLEAISQYSRDVVLSHDRIPVMRAVEGVERHIVALYLWQRDYRENTRKYKKIP